MAHFFTECQGNGSPTSRNGTLKSGVRAVVASWHGACHVRMYDKDGVTHVHVTLGRWSGAGIERTIYDGPVNV